MTFTETGLKAGTSWYVVYNGANRTSTTSSITFSSTNGTFSYVVGIVNGYKSSSSNGTVSVSGAALSEAVTFTEVSTSPSIGGSTIIAIIGAAIVIVIIAAVALVMMRGRRRS